jgi:hypothetical protein
MSCHNNPTNSPQQQQKQKKKNSSLFQYSNLYTQKMYSENPAGTTHQKQTRRRFFISIFLTNSMLCFL